MIVTNIAAANPSKAASVVVHFLLFGSCGRNKWRKWSKTRRPQDGTGSGFTREIREEYCPTSSIRKNMGKLTKK